MIDIVLIRGIARGNTECDYASQRYKFGGRYINLGALYLKGTIAQPVIFMRRNVLFLNKVGLVSLWNQPTTTRLTLPSQTLTRGLKLNFYC